MGPLTTNFILSTLTFSHQTRACGKAISVVQRGQRSIRVSAVLLEIKKVPGKNGHAILLPLFVPSRVLLWPFCASVDAERQATNI